MKFLSHVLETKGLLHSLERSAQILRRYSFGKRRFSEMMSYLDANYNGSDVKVTFCITASLLNDHSRFIKRFQELGHEFAAHGYIHTNMKKKTREEQAEIVRKSYENFERFDIPVYGFRCPYLSYNTDTMDALLSSSFSWTSNNVIFWESIRHNRHAENHIKKLGLLYKFLYSGQALSMPGFLGRLVDIPITAPDDEMIFERCRIKDNEEISAIWLRIMSRIYERGELFHLLFHPERFMYVKESIRAVVDGAKRLSPPVWFGTLHEITKWHRKRKEIRWTAEKLDSRDFRIILQSPSNSTVLINAGARVGSGLFYRNYRVAEPSIKGDGLFVFATGDPERHMIRISERAPKELEDFLSDEGFYLERSSGPREGSLFIDWNEPFRDADKLGLLEKIDSSPHPLLRVWRWPEGSRAALTISSDVDSINVADFLRRFIYF